MSKVFSKNMIRRRTELGWTQEQAAKAIGGIKRSNIGAWEEGRSYPQVDKLMAIKRAYKLKDLNQFLFGNKTDTLSSREIDVISKYYALTEKEKKAVDVLLGLE